MAFFRIVKKSKKSWARAGVISTPHGVIHTPAFVPVGTQAAVKTLSPQELNDLGVEVALANTYHLYLRPGDERVRKMGGLHGFSGFSKPWMTDSGGYQVFSLGLGGGKDRMGKISNSSHPERSEGSLANAREPASAGDSSATPQNDKYMIGGAERLRALAQGNSTASNSLVSIDEDGVTFKSHLDGSMQRFTPEKSMQIQRNLGADIIFSFDECGSPLQSYEYTKESVDRTHRWAVRSLAAHTSPWSPPSQGGDRGGQALFGIVQGSNFRDLREHSAKYIAGLDFDGFGIGGALGSSKQEMHTILEWITPHLPPQKPRHLLGIGHLDDFEECIKRGMDTFDCVFPMRLARHGVLLTSGGRITITNAKYGLMNSAPVQGCSCYTCTRFTAAYMHHLFRAGEWLAPRLATIHNIFTTIRLVKSIRKRILEGKL